MKTIIGKCKYFTPLFDFTNALFFEYVFLDIGIQYVINIWTKGNLLDDNDFFRQNAVFS